MNWIFIAISGYFFYAVAGVTDKFLLRQRATTKPLVYTFYIGLLSIFTFALAPFGLSWPGWNYFWLALLAGLIMFFALLSFFKSLDVNEASRDIPLIGGLTPIVVLSLSYVFLAEGFGWPRLVAFSLLVLGGFLISLKTGRGKNFLIKGGFFVAAAILLNAAYLVLIKYVFGQEGFLNGFVWSRLGLVLSAVFVLFFPKWRRLIMSSGRQASAGLGAILVSNKILAGVGSLLVHLAVSRGSVSMVNAMQGTEYGFLFLLTIFLSKKFPFLLKERIDFKTFIQKTAAILLIAGGLAFLTLW